MNSGAVAAAWKSGHWRSALRPGEHDIKTGRANWIEDGSLLLEALASSVAIRKGGQALPHVFDRSHALQALTRTAALLGSGSPLIALSELPPSADAALSALAATMEAHPCVPECESTGCLTALLNILAADLPVLVRLLATRLRYWGEALNELSYRLDQDQRILSKEFGVHGKLTQLSFPAGDEHRRGRATAILQFSCGTILVYKPRTQSLLARLNGITAELNAHYPDVAVRFPRASDQGNYGWAAFVEPVKLDLERHSSSVYRRLGQAGALTWALAGRDIHFGNIVLSEDALYIIDEEVFGLGVVSDNPSMPIELREELRFFEASPAYTGIFPYRTPLPGRSQPADFSLYSSILAAVAGSESSEYHRQAADQFASAFLEGYDEALTAVAATVHSSREFRCKVRDLAKEDCRLIPLPTARYGDLLGQSLHPHILASGSAREQFFQNELKNDSAFKPWRGALLPDEIDELFDGDVPLFHVRVDDKIARGASGRGYELLDYTGVDVLRHRMAIMGTERLSLHWQAGAALKCADMNRGAFSRSGMPPSYPASIDQSTTDTAILLDAAEVLLARVRGLAIETIDGSIAWADMRYDPRRRWHVGFAGTSLRSGTAGILLAASLLGSQGQWPGLVTSAKRLSELLRGQWLQEAERISQGAGASCSGSFPRNWSWQLNSSRRSLAARSARSSI